MKSVDFVRDARAAALAEQNGATDLARGRLASLYVEAQRDECRPQVRERRVARNAVVGSRVDVGGHIGERFDDGLDPIGGQGPRRIELSGGVGVGVAVGGIVRRAQQSEAHKSSCLRSGRAWQGASYLPHDLGSDPLDVVVTWT